MESRSKCARAELLRFPIAITGIGCRLPGGIDSPDRLWEQLCAGVDAIVPTPADRWNVAAFYSPDIASPGRSVLRFGGFLERFDQFDCRFFGVSPREAMRIDPQQRLLLQTTWEAFEDAGIAVDGLADSDTGVFIGVSYCDFATIQGRDLENADGHSGTGSGLSMTANRISHRFAFRGPSIAIDTACSSSLVAVDLACHSLWTGQSQIAVAGGVNLILSPETSVFLSKGAMLSPDGRCFSFDARANGYVRGEGVGVVVLMPLERALAEGKPVYAVIRATATNQDGRTPSLTQPDVDAQVAVIREACRRAAVTAEEISYVEAHGTGTPVGDPIEVNAIATAIGRKSSPVTIGSIKTNIGHLESASGIAGLIKTALCILHGKIPRNLNFEQPNPDIDFAALNVRVASETVDWRAQNRQLIAGVNSFGFGGTNAHVILSEPPAKSGEAVDPARRDHDREGSGKLLFPISAATPSALNAVAERLFIYLHQPDTRVSETDLAGSLTRGRSHLEYRAIFADSSLAGLCEQLQMFVAGRSSEGAVAGRIDPDPRAVFVFVGQGTQWPGMGRDLLQREAVFRQALERIDGLFQNAGGFSMLSFLRDDTDPGILNRTDISQPLIFALQVGLAELWRSWGVVPAAVIGHSVGEVAAACVSGALSLEDAVTVIYHRSRLQQNLYGKGGMLAVTLPLSDIEPLLPDFSVEIAAVNSATAITLAGEKADLEAIQLQLTQRQVACRYINTEYAFHSRQMEPLREQLIESLAGVRSRTPSIPMMSTVTAALVAAGDLEASYWWRNVRQVVRFAAGIDRLISSGNKLFVEVGPHSALAGSLIEALDERECSGTILQSMTRGKSGVEVMRRSLCTLFTRGIRPAWDAINPQPAALIKLPGYPWENEAYWQEGENSRNYRFRRIMHPLLGERSHTAAATWTSEISLRSHPYLADHNLAGDAIYPAAAYIEMMFAAGRQIFDGDAFEITDIRFAETLYVESDRFELVETSYQAASGRIEIHSRKKESEDPWTLKATAGLRRAPRRTERRMPAQSTLETQSVIEHAQFYARIRDEHADFGATFRGVRRLHIKPGAVQAEIELPEKVPHDDFASYLLHPALLDACLQCARGFIPFNDGDLTISQIPVSARRITLHRAPTREVTAWLQMQVSNDLLLQTDISIFDESGSLVALLEDLKYLRMRHAAKSSVTHNFYRTAWHARQLADDSTPAVACGSWIIFADQQGLARELAAYLREAGCRCVLLFHGSQFDDSGKDEFVLRSDSREEIHQVLTGLCKSGNDIRGFVHCWNLDIAAPQTLTPKAIVAGQRLGCVSVLHLVQEMLDTGLMDQENRPELLILTRGAHAVDVVSEKSQAVGHPLHAAVWGLARVISNELTGLRCRVVDLEPGSNDIAPVVNELAFCDGEPESAWRGRQRLVNRLVAQQIDQLPAKLLPVRSNGKPRPFRLEIPTPGGFERLVLQEIGIDEPGEGEVRVRVRAAGLNFRDVMAALGVLPDDAEQDPAWQALGLECAGVIDALGPGIANLTVGDRVLVSARRAFATHIVVPADQVMAVPSHLSDVQAATIPVAFSTAYLALMHIAQIEQGETVLIHAAAGAVGLAAVQICQMVGAEIFATAGSEAKRSYLRSLGIKHVMDSRTLDFAEEIMLLTEGRGIDVVLNSLAGDFLHHSLNLLAPFGRFLEIGKRDIYENSSLGMGVFKRSIRFFAVDVARIFRERQDLAQRVMRELSELFVSGPLQPLPTTIYPISNAETAFRDMSQAKQIGKLVLDFNDARARVVSSSADRPLISAAGSYLITGGLSGFGLRVAQWLVAQGAGSIVLTSRSGKVRNSDAAQFEALRETGADIHVIAADIADYDQVKPLVERIQALKRPLRGVIHSAAVLEDSVFFNMDQQSFEKVLAPKVSGAWNLHQATLDRQLDFFVLLSSLAADLGTPGQANYAAANAFLNGLARYRRATGLPALAVNLGALSETGLVSRSQEIARVLAGYGVEGLDPDTALKSLGLMLSKEVSEMTVASIDWTRMSASSADVPLGRRLSLLTRQQDDPSSTHRRQILQELGMVAPEQAVRILETFLRHEVARILAVRFDAVETDRPLRDLGLDSLAVFELKSSLESQGFVKIPLSKLKTHPTISMIASLVLSYAGEQDTGSLDEAHGSALIRTNG